MTDIAKILMPHMTPPRNNSDLSSETQLGVEMEEMVRLPVSNRIVVEESLRARFERLIQWSEWQLLLTGTLKVSEPEKEERHLGPGSITEVSGKNGVRKTLYENEGQESFVVCNTATMRANMEFFNELRGEANALVRPTDSGYLSGDTLTAQNHIKFFKDGVVLVVIGTAKVGRIFKVKAKFDIREIGGQKYLRGWQRFFPDLISPERLAVCNSL